MAESSLFWDGATVGDHGPYGDADLCDTFFAAVFGSSANKGVLRGWGNELEVAIVAGNTVSVASGGAFVHGGWYENTASHNLTGLANNDYVVIRRAWVASPAPPIGIAANSARLTFVAALTQDAALATYWDVPLARVTVVAGVVTAIADLREFCEFSTEIIQSGVSTDAIQDNSLTPDKFTDQTRWVTRGVGEMIGDSSSPATMMSYGRTGYPYVIGNENTWYRFFPNKPFWKFPYGSRTSVWLTFRVPEDIVCSSLYGPSTMDLYLWTSGYDAYWAYVNVGNQVRWGINAWTGDDTGPFETNLQNVEATLSYFSRSHVEYYDSGLEGWTTLDENGDPIPQAEGISETVTQESFPTQWRYAERDYVGQIDVWHGDVVHIEVYRRSPYGVADMRDSGIWGNVGLFMLEATYTAES